MAKQKGEKYKCDECGLVILVESPCTCETCDIVCCDQPMKPMRGEKTVGSKSKK